MSAAFELRSVLVRGDESVTKGFMLLSPEERARFRRLLDDADQSGMLQNFIDALKARLAELEQHAAKDVTVLEADIAKAKDAVEAELAALLAKLQNA